VNRSLKPLKPLIFLLAGIYLMVDAVFLAIARPMAHWFAGRRIFEGLRKWIVSLPPYPALALFAVPLIVLEPVKPVAAYMAATGHVLVGLAIFIVGEILKLVLVERLFVINRDKLMSISAFAWIYHQYRQIMNRLEETEAWQAIRRSSKIARYAVRSTLLELRQKPARISFQQR
jgi:hypothetical protein